MEGAYTILDHKKKVWDILAGHVTALSKDHGVFIQAVEAHAVLSVSHEFNLHCSQPTWRITFHMCSRNYYSNISFVWRQKPVCLYQYCFKYLLLFFWNIYWSSQNPLKTLSVFPPLHHVLLKSLGFVLPWASLMLFSLEFKIESRAWTEDTIVFVQNCIIMWFVSLHCYVHYGQIIIIFSDYSVFRTLQFYWVLVAMLTFFFLLLLRNLDLRCTRCCSSGDKSKSPFS